MFQFKKSLAAGIMFTLIAATGNLQAADAAAAVPAVSAAPAQQSGFGNFMRRTGIKLLCYVPDRLLDLCDCFTLEAGVGGYGADVFFTHALAFGGSVGPDFRLGWEHKRQFGGYTQYRWNADLLLWRLENCQRNNLLGNYLNMWRRYNGLQYPAEQTDSVNSRDFWEIGAEGGLLFNVKVAFHPVALADFICGFLLIDFADDDFVNRE